MVVEGEPSGVEVDSFGGTVRVEWDHEAAMTPLGQLPFFIDYLKTAGLFDAFVADCPLRYGSPNAPKKRDVLGTAMLAMLAGAKRYAHVAAVRGDGVLPELLGMTKVVSEDAVRRAFKTIDEAEGAAWLRGHLAFCVEPLLAEPWILDVDTTIKPLYGHQEGAVLGYNPKKPGRPSHCYHTYSMASTRLVFDVDVSPGDEHTSKHGAPGLWAFLDRLPRDLWPAILRGDSGFGNEGVMREAEARRLPYLFKLRLTRNVRRMIEKLSGREWVSAGQGFWAKESEVRLEGWSRERRAIVLRRRLKGAVGLSYEDENGAAQLTFAEIGEATDIYEYSVLVTSLDEETESVRPALSRPGGRREHLRRDEEPMGLGRLHHARSRALPAGGAPARALLRLVEHLRSSRRSERASRGDHQPAAVPVGGRDANAPCPADHDPRRQLSRQGEARGARARRRRRLPAWTGEKCGAVDPPANMARHPLARLPGVPRRPPAPRAAAARAVLMQPKARYNRATLSAN